MCIGLFLDSENTPAEMRVLLAGAKINTPDVKYHLGEILPGEQIPVVAYNQNMRAHAFFMTWGFPDQTRKKSPWIASTRLETIENKILFIDGYRQRRCVVVVSSYFEWKKVDGKLVKYIVYPNEGDFMYLGGIYRLQNDRPYLVILTQPACETLEGINDRMPVIIPREHCAEWIKPSRRPKYLLKYVDHNINCKIAEESCPCPL